MIPTKEDVTTGTIPTHVGLILDGNRRWAKSNGKSSLDGHKSGYENLKRIVQAAFDRGVTYVSAYVFSTENWGRSQEEVNYLMNLIMWVAKNEVGQFDKKNIRIRFLGDTERLAPKVIKAMRDAEEKTAGNDGGVLLLCLNYGGRQEIARAVSRLIHDKPGVTSVSESDIDQYIDEPKVPPVDLIIRTSGEQRISNFMLWRAAYSELFFTDVHWPEFTENHLDSALKHYASRQRRFGT